MPALAPGRPSRSVLVVLKRARVQLILGESVQFTALGASDTFAVQVLTQLEAAKPPDFEFFAEFTGVFTQ